MIENVRIKLSALWICLMLTYLLGDVLRIFAGDFVAGEISGMEMNQWFLVGMAALMLLPIVMVFLSLTLKQPAIRWVSIVVAILLLLVNAVGLRDYPSLYDQVLIVVGLIFNALTVWYAWKWGRS